MNPTNGPGYRPTEMLRTSKVIATSIKHQSNIKNINIIFKQYINVYQITYAMVFAGYQLPQVLENFAEKTCEISN